MIDGLDLSIDGAPDLVQRIYEAITNEYGKILSEHIHELKLGLDPIYFPYRSPVNLTGRLTVRGPAFGHNCGRGRAWVPVDAHGSLCQSNICVEARRGW